MRLFALTTSITAALSTVGTARLASVHLRVHMKDTSCSISNESQCDSQNWTSSTCCADPNYECRWSDDGQNVKRCQKIYTSQNIIEKDYIDGEYAHIADWGNCTATDAVCSEPASVCLQQSDTFWQCLPETLPAGGAICGMKYDEYDWLPEWRILQELHNALVLHGGDPARWIRAKQSAVVAYRKTSVS